MALKACGGLNPLGSKYVCVCSYLKITGTFIYIYICVYLYYKDPQNGVGFPYIYLDPWGNPIPRQLRIEDLTPSEPRIEYL